MGYTQWFFFSVQGMQPGETYTFNIVNQDKPNSQFNFGMQPVIWSAAAAAAKMPGWRRQGENIAYFRNSLSTAVNKQLFTVSFSIKGSPYGADDTVFVAYHYPYTYTDLQRHLSVIAAPVSFRFELVFSEINTGFLKGATSCDAPVALPNDGWTSM